MSATAVPYGMCPTHGGYSGWACPVCSTAVQPSPIQLPPTSVEPLPPREGSITAALQVSEDPMAAPNWLRWRVGRKVGRTIYAMVSDKPSDDDALIGVMDTRELAEEVVRAHNAVLEKVQRR